ncbi:MAG TPA: SlyX family protein [Micavibrio sp.]|nr:SlyX family protein [Micavibrio sp.]
MSEEINRLEALIAHQERQIQDLSDMVNLHRKEIDILKARLDRTQKKIVDMELGAAEEPGENLTPTEQALRDKPPHY